MQHVMPGVRTLTAAFVSYMFRFILNSLFLSPIIRLCHLLLFGVVFYLFFFLKFYLFVCYPMEEEGGEEG